MELGLTQAQREFRKNAIGGSDANIILSGDAERILKLWRLKRGEIDPDNLDDVLPVQMGNATEPFNRFWFTKNTGWSVTCAGDEHLSFDYPHMSATLDGIAGHETEGQALFEAKHVNQFAKEAETLAKYTPQLHHNMIVTGLSRAVLSVFYGTFNWRAHWIDFDPIYADALIYAETRFWQCVKSGEPPAEMPVVEAPVEAVKIVDMSMSNSWSEHAANWLAHKAAAKKFGDAADSIKELVEADVKEARGKGIVVTRSKSNSLSIKAIK